MTEPAFTPDDTPEPVLHAVPDLDEQEAAREWADEKAEWIGRIWLRRFPKGRDW